MGEYGREQRNQLSRAIVNCETGSKQLKKFIDKRSHNIQMIDTIQCSTQITHQTKDYDYLVGNQTVGSKVTAFLDPNDALQGSSPGNEIDNLMIAANTAPYKATNMRGHLLNSNLGGFGVKENLFPITKSANGFHTNHVESPVKKLLYGPLAKSGVGVCYEVNVNSSYILDNQSDKLECKIWEADPQTHAKSLPTVLEVDISSNLLTGDGTVDRETTDNYKGRYYDTNIPVKWKESGSGKTIGNRFEAEKAKGHIVIS